MYISPRLLLIYQWHLISNYIRLSPPLRYIFKNTLLFQIFFVFKLHFCVMAFLMSFSVTEFLYTFLVSLCITLVLFKWFRERKYPPGPIGVPVLGYFPFLGKMPNKKLKDLSRKYGDIFSFYLGSELYVCINNYEILKELLNNPALLFRPPHGQDFIMGRGGLVGMNGEEWQEQRRFAFHTMRDLGLGKGHWENLIKENVAELVEEIRSWKGESKETEDIITNFQSNTSISLLFGRHLNPEKDGETLKILRYSTREFMGYFSPVSVNVSVVWMRKFMEITNLFGYRRFFVLLREFENIFRKEVEERMKSPESLARDDYIGCYFRELKKRNKETKDHSFTIENLMGNLMFLFLAGSDSTMASMTWLLLLIADNPEVQTKVHKEIDNVLGGDGSVTYDDRKKFPYTMATIFEMLRWVPIAALFPARMAVEDIECNGYLIPKGACVVSNAWAIMRDPKYFENPDLFIPERFLTENGTKVKTKVDGWISFSFGKRDCPGDGVAIMTIFLYFVAIMQKFRVTAPPGKKVDLEPIFGAAMLIKPQELCFIER